MSFNLDEIAKIAQATGGFFKKRARISIGLELAELFPKILLAQSLPENENRELLITLLNGYTESRHEALLRGANNSGHPLWAPVAVCESWIQALLMNDDDLGRIEEKIFDLICRSHKSAISKSTAALVARDLAWQYFANYRNEKHWTQYVIQSVATMLEKENRGIPPTREDIALVLKQAVHYIENQGEAIVNHIEAMEACHKAQQSGIHLNFGGQIADYMDDAPYLETFRT